MLTWPAQFPRPPFQTSIVRGEPSGPGGEEPWEAPDIDQLPRLAAGREVLAKRGSDEKIMQTCTGAVRFKGPAEGTPGLGAHPWAQEHYLQRSMCLAMPGLK